MPIIRIVELAVAALVIAGCFVGFSMARHRLQEKPDDKKIKRRKRLFFWGMVIAIWFLVGTVFTIAGDTSKGIDIEFEMFSPRTTLAGVSLANSTLLLWVVIAVVFVLALAFRFLAVPRFKDEPKGLQNVMETAVEAMDNFCTGAIEKSFAEKLSPYMFSVAILLIGCAATELFGQRPPTADLVFNFTLSLVTFALINICGIQKKGVGGRLKGMATPSPVIFPMKVLSDVAVPVSLACRLFGNMMGGMIVMDLLKGVLGGYSVGITSVAGLYFNLFHPLIQTYIFIVLSLTFINEAVETVE